MILLRIFCVTAALSLFPAVAYAVETISCQRISIDSSGFVNFAAAASWYPEDIIIRVDGEKAYFVNYDHRKGTVKKNKSNGRLEIDFTSSNNDTATKVVKFQRFTKGNPFLQVQQSAGFRDPGRAYYDCGRKSG